MQEVSATIDNLSTAEIDRIRIIRSELINSCFGLHDEETFLYAFLDYMHLLFQPTPSQGPLAFTLWRGERCVYSSFRDLYYTATYNLHQSMLQPPRYGVRIFPTHEFWLSIHRVKTDKLRELEEERAGTTPTPSILQESILSTQNVDNLLRNAFLLLRGEHSNLGTRPSNIPDFETLLLESLRISDRPEYPTNDFLHGLEDLDYRQAMLPFLDSFRSVLDDVFLELKPPASPEHEPELGNIFCIVRTVQSGELRLGSFPYTAGLLLSNEQREEFTRWCTTDCKKKDTRCPIGLPMKADCLEYLETPLGPQSRSAADVTFCSGIIDFGRIPNDQVWDRIDRSNAAENRRRLVERCVYPRERTPHPAGKQQHPDSSLYYVPVHVNGIPWLVLCTFAPSGRDSKRADLRWKRNYAFYRDATRKAVSTLRWRAAENYISQLATVAFASDISWQDSAEQACADVNALWDTASRVFPFPRFTIHPIDEMTKEQHSEHLRLRFRNREWEIRYMDNPYFGPKHVRWKSGIVNPSRMRDSLGRALKLQAAEHEVIELRMEKIKHDMREFLIRVIRHGFGNSNESTKGFIDGAYHLLLQQRYDDDKVLAYLRKGSEDCCVTRLHIIGLQHYGIVEKTITPYDLQELIEARAGLLNTVRISLSSEVGHCHLPGRIVLILAELIANALRVHRREKTLGHPLELNISVQRTHAVLSLKNICREPKVAWLADGKTAVAAQFPPEHGLRYCVRLLEEIEGSLSLAKNAEEVRAIVTLPVTPGGNRG